MGLGTTARSRVCTHDVLPPSLERSDRRLQCLFLRHFSSGRGGRHCLWVLAFVWKFCHPEIDFPEGGTTDPERGRSSPPGGTSRTQSGYSHHGWRDYYWRRLPLQFSL